MNIFNKVFFRNTSYTFLANIFSLIISTVAILIIPRKFGIEEYGYFQLYLFYSSYVGFFHLGWPDGLYLRYGGKEYEEIDEDIMRTQFFLIVLCSLLLGLIMWRLFPHFVFEKEKIVVLELTAICAIVIIPRTLLWLLLQSIGKITDYAKFTVIEKLVYIFLVMAFLFLDATDYKFLILADLCGKILSLVCTCINYPRIVFGKISKIRATFYEIKENVTVGIKLMLANIASMLILGIIRSGIEKNWGITAFSKISLTLTLCNLILVFINAIGIVLFPMLKKLSNSQLRETYQVMELLVSCILFLFLAIYYPLKALLLIWLPQYSESLYYMIYLFPICIFESKMSLIYTTYLKTLRQEKVIMKINVYIVFLSAILSYINIVLIKNLDLMVMSILILLWLRYAFAQFSVAREIKVSFMKTISTDTLLCAMFILSARFISKGGISLTLYMVFLVAFFILEKKNIEKAIKSVREI
ncbi:hypothetical protein V3C10_15015 [[Clostridium] symbiosum]|uniref:lipopolysaccharide biosynthesis protein n=1 Tax=Clostridium symbiosum TaxID=1512 RepID=UPI001D06A922|nr:hypothetical protein [[Clostridium] symbiosum]MCB6610938.1 hypothetical protein [[Clostridium] symbiosum]MCB6931616.1 hypothetical protein [[Clostridium] symbiosum]